uniref:7TM GPCR serpentine receptor class x (Srx) domain-containing protein n=1 Tax=Panagrellus redivivus TaxID=6233 RepID=A0A7E4WBI7_PANRE
MIGDGSSRNRWMIGDGSSRNRWMGDIQINLLFFIVLEFVGHGFIIGRFNPVFIDITLDGNIQRSKLITDVFIGENILDRGVLNLTRIQHLAFNGIHDTLLCSTSQRFDGIEATFYGFCLVSRSINTII